jgi:hypothetical protein
MPKTLVTDYIINNCHCKEDVFHLAEKLQICHFLAGEVQIFQCVMTSGKCLTCDGLTQLTAAATEMCMGSNQLLALQMLYCTRKVSINCSVFRDSHMDLQTNSYLGCLQMCMLKPSRLASSTLTRITDTSHDDLNLNLFMITSCNIHSL